MEDIIHVIAVTPLAGRRTNSSSYTTVVHKMISDYVFCQDLRCGFSPGKHCVYRKYACIVQTGSVRQQKWGQLCSGPGFRIKVLIPIDRAKGEGSQLCSWRGAVIPDSATT